MKQANDLGQLNVFLSQMHPGSNLLCGIHYTIGMYDFQLNLIILSVIFVQITFKCLLCLGGSHDGAADHNCCTYIDLADLLEVRKSIAIYYL